MITIASKIMVLLIKTTPEEFSDVLKMIHIVVIGEIEHLFLLANAPIDNSLVNKQGIVSETKRCYLLVIHK